MNFIKSIYLTPRFFYAIGIIVLTFFISYFFHALYNIGLLLIGALIVIFAVDMLLLYMRKNGIEAQRIVPDKLSNGDENLISVNLKSNYDFDTNIELIDEIPVEFQIRDFSEKRLMKSSAKEEITYHLRPQRRGLYQFGKINCYVSTQKLGFVSRRYSIENKVEQEVPCYPSFVQLKKYSLMAFSQTLTDSGLKRMRKVGSSTEFDQINRYVKGDDIRHINWKASAKISQLMVNKYIEEKSQPVYSIVDSGRSMKMPFGGMSLLDYAINASLVISNIALKKEDKAGVAAFSTSLTDLVVADRRSNQMSLILQALYNIKTEHKETDFGRLYTYLKHRITQRSLLLLYTNFETKDSLQRQLKYLKAINRSHLVVVIMFKNSELDHLTQRPTQNKRNAYDKVIAEKFVYEKKLIVRELNKNGIITILTDPKDLIINTINKYLEIKAKNLL